MLNNFKSNQWIEEKTTTTISKRNYSYSEEKLLSKHKNQLIEVSIDIEVLKIF